MYVDTSIVNVSRSVLRIGIKVILVQWKKTLIKSCCVTLGEILVSEVNLNEILLFHFKICITLFKQQA